jgi:hypothetical protein
MLLPLVLAPVLALSVLGAAPSAAPVDLSGTWVLDPSLSQLPRAGAAPSQEAGETAGQPLTLVLAQGADSLTITRQGRRGSSTVVLRFDGRETETPGPRGGTLKMRSSWQGATLVSEGRQEMETPRGPVTVDLREERSISADGQTLTVRTITRGPRGEMTRTMVFRKRAS